MTEKLLKMMEKRGELKNVNWIGYAAVDKEIMRNIRKAKEK